MPYKAATLVAALCGVSLLIAAVPASAEVSPTVNPTIVGDLGTNGWYRGTGGSDYVVLNWNYQDPGGVVDHTVGCEAAIHIDGPTMSTSRTCTAYIKPFPDGGSVSWTKVVKIDADPPIGVSATLSRNPDFNGWYNHPVGITWQGSDATSGIASCGAGTYAGPDATGNAVGGSCTDKAGNTASSSIAINYDATAPVLKKVRVDSKAGSDLVHWASTSPSDTVVVQRWARGNEKQQAVLFRGSGTAFADGKVAPGLEYNYAVQTFDQAGNASKRIVVAGLPKVLLLGKTGYVPRAAAKPILRWNRVRGAQYYNVQLYRGTKRVFAAWPAKNQLGLPAGWRWNGKRQRLSPGKYRWYVWAGFGARSFAHYQTVGSAQFIVPR